MDGTSSVSLAAAAVRSISEVQLQFPVNPVPACLELAQERGQAGQGSGPAQGCGPGWVCSIRNQGAALPWLSSQLGQQEAVARLPEGNVS